MVCAPCALAAVGFGALLGFISFSNALVSLPRSLMRAMNCCCSSGDMPLKRSIIRAGSNPRRPPPSPCPEVADGAGDGLLADGAGELCDGDGLGEPCEPCEALREPRPPPRLPANCCASFGTS